MRMLIATVNSGYNVTSEIWVSLTLYFRVTHLSSWGYIQFVLGKEKDSSKVRRSIESVFITRCLLYPALTVLR